MKFKIWTEGSDLNDPYEFEIYAPVPCTAPSLEVIAEEFAEVYFNTHDGWEDTWPVMFNIADENGDFLGAVLVGMETSPYFSAMFVGGK